ncbi:MAG: CapA family protein [Candidatus Saccharimonadales bacterium]
MKKLWVVAVLVVVSSVGLWLWTAKDSSSPTSDNKAASKTSPQPQQAKNSVRMYAMGDMLPHDSVVSQAKQGNSYNFTSYFSSVQPLYKDADAIFCNPEAPVSGDTYGVSGYPAFNAPTAFARDLASSSGAGCNVITMGNNHINDRGQDVLEDSVAVWRGIKPLAVTGANTSPAEQKQVPTFTQNGVTVAVVALNEYNNRPPANSYALNSLSDETLVKTLMTTAKGSADAVIVSIHWKQENITQSTAAQRAAVARVAALGADVIVGTGPHVWQEVAYVPSSSGKQTLVWYSIGNMLSSQLTIDQLTSGIAGFTIHKEGNGAVKVDTITIDPTFMSYTWPAAAKAADNLAARSDLRLQPLKDADSRIAAMFGPSRSSAERLDFLKQTVGSDVPVTYR